MCEQDCPDGRQNEASLLFPCGAPQFPSVAEVICIATLNISRRSIKNKPPCFTKAKKRRRFLRAFFRKRGTGGFVDNLFSIRTFFVHQPAGKIGYDNGTTEGRIQSSRSSHPVRTAAGRRSFLPSFFRKARFERTGLLRCTVSAAPAVGRRVPRTDGPRPKDGRPWRWRCRYPGTGGGQMASRPPDTGRPGRPGSA